MQGVSVSTKELLQAAEQLSGQELDELVSNLLHLRAQRMAPCLPHTEDALLQQINASLPSKERRRYRQLIQKRRTLTLSPQEHEELLKMTEQEERHNLERVEALRSEEHTSELQSRPHLVCRLLLEKKK